ncbi:chitinase [Salmonella enterica subsp. enterica serovar Portland]|uniref:glycosyl hydrolase family 18 protein n=1 Tax=Salmonella enterica TaxID=28901 RepID=UPI00127B16C2|nr:chitinase [Salmonella enterica subsp. enterica]EBX6017657.1 chitinase [Salmonella enterica subsp. enterica serovar Dortmund]ECA8972106.1 chitinase [Salmonella enterica subsp. enterica serovar Omuna]EDH5631634.1 chitinase [Salmonella enterica subsp. enterica serovar Claibornei]EDS6037198.1 chitinase [Salmonella enterica subsp. enterica serovar Lexington]EEB9696668.1 chitinase [Salmonella enterica subsp. enterica serovar Miami]EEJ7235422.1 chitinase [Salmonella enterica subsp. salamae]EGZ43
MATSKLIQGDTLTETTHAANGFDPATSDDKISYTSARVAKPVYNKYKNSTTKPKVFGYYTDWSQYDSRLQGDMSQPGRGYDLTNVSPTAYDKLILGFVGITGFKKIDTEERDVVAEAAALCGKVKYEPTFLDPWGDFQSYINLGFETSGWDIDPKTVTQANTKGMLGALRDMQAKAKAAGHTLALSMSIGGWSMSNGFHETAASDSSRKIFAKGVVKLFKQFPMFSEVDIDWEYPNNEGAGNPFGPEDGANYVLLIAELRKQLDSAGLSNVKISIAASAVTTIFDYAKVKDLMAAGLYGINLMTYDFFGTPWAETLGHHTNRKALEEGGWAVETIVDHLLAEGFSAERINIGYAGYTRNARQAEIESLSPLKGSYNPGTGVTTGSFESGTNEWYDVIYSYLDLENQKGRNGFNVYTDQVADADYLYNPESKLFLSLDTPRTVKAKGEYAAKLGLGGVFTWTIDQDNGVLVNAVREGLGYEIESEVIDMEPFYFEGINVENDEEQSGSDDTQKVNHAPKAAIELMVVGGSTVQLSGAGSSDEDNDELSFSWGVPSQIAVADKTAEIIEVVVPEVSEKTAFQFTLFVRDCYNEPSSQQRFVLTAVPALSQVQPEPEEEEETIVPVPDEEEDTTPAEDDTPADDTASPYAQWDASTIYGANWGTFEIVSWKGHNYQVKWWSVGDQPDLNCGAGGAWTDLGAY